MNKRIRYQPNNQPPKTNQRNNLLIADLIIQDFKRRKRKEKLKNFKERLKKFFKFKTK